MEANFLLYSVVSFASTVLYYYFLPETRGKTLHELQSLQKSEIIRVDETDADTEKKLITTYET